MLAVTITATVDALDVGNVSLEQQYYWDSIVWSDMASVDSDYTIVQGVLGSGIVDSCYMQPQQA